MRLNHWIAGDYKMNEVCRPNIPSPLLRETAPFRINFGMPHALYCQDYAVDTVITGANKPEQVNENAKAADIKLGPDVLARLDEILGIDRNRRI